MWLSASNTGKFSFRDTAVLLLGDTNVSSCSQDCPVRWPPLVRKRRDRQVVRQSAEERSLRPTRGVSILTSMSFPAQVAAGDPLLGVRTYAAELDAWLARRPACLRVAAA